MAKVGRKRRPYFVPEIQGPVRLTLGTRYGILGEAQSWMLFLTSRNFSSLVIDTLCHEVGGAEGDIAVACFYFDFAAQKELSTAIILGSLLKQVVRSFRLISKEIMDAFEKYEKVIGGQRLQLPEIVKLLGSLASMRRIFFCLDALDECAAPDRAKILLSLSDIIRMSPTARVFLTGRPHVG